MANLKTFLCSGEGQGSCKRCNDKGIWNAHWMWDLYKIEGFEGCYCSECKNEILEEADTMQKREQRSRKHMRLPKWMMS